MSVRWFARAMAGLLAAVVVAGLVAGPPTQPSRMKSAGAGVSITHGPILGRPGGGLAGPGSTGLPDHADPVARPDSLRHSRRQLPGRGGTRPASRALVGRGPPQKRGAAAQPPARPDTHGRVGELQVVPG